MNDQQIEATIPSVSDMVNSFLAWRLPLDFRPDCGISFVQSVHPDVWPTGTNLLHAGQAREMIEHLLHDATRPIQPPADDAHVAPGCELFSDPSQKKHGIIPPGSIVKLKSGGPDMVAGYTNGDGMVMGTWYMGENGIGFADGWFHPAQLKVITPA